MSSFSIIDKVVNLLQSRLDNSYSKWSEIPYLTEVIPETMDAAKLLIDKLNKKEGIYLVHDSDADGIGSAIVSKSFFDFLEYQNRYHRITNRADGYGFLPLHVDEALKNGCSLIITTDNGITSKEAVEYAKSRNVDVIITDHHTVDINTKPNTFLIDPQLADNQKFKEVSGTVVAYLFYETVARLLGFDRPDFLNKIKAAEELGLTTISDVMPMQHMNRLFVKNALKYFNKPRKPYTQVFKSNLKYEDQVTSETIGFSLAPLLNAANRFGVAEQAFYFMSAENVHDASQHWTYLNHLNEKRKAIVQQYVDMLKDAKIEFGDLIYVNLNNVEKGILGLLANKLASQYNKPAIVTCTTDTGIVHGSGRSVGQVNMLEILKKCGIESGGHTHAFGCSFEYQKIPEVVKQLVSNLKEIPRDLFAEPDKSDFEITFNMITKDLYNAIEQFEPFGHKFEKPVFTTLVTVVKAYRFGKQNNHTKFVLKDINNDEREIVAFFETRNFQPGDKLKINYTLYWDSWNQDVNARIQQIFKRS